MRRSGRTWKILALILAFDAIVFLAATVPGWLGHVGSEHHQWSSLGVAMITGYGGLVLMALTVGAYLFARSPAE